MTTLQETAALVDTVRYKIHAISSVRGQGLSANNNVFYTTLHAAEEKVREYMARDPNVGFVIMRTYKIFKPARAPMIEYVVLDGGVIQEQN